MIKTPSLALMTPEKAVELLTIYVHEHRTELSPDELASHLLGIEALRRVIDKRHKIGVHWIDTLPGELREFISCAVDDSQGKQGVVAYDLDELIKEAEGLVSALKQAKETAQRN